MPAITLIGPWFGQAEKKGEQKNAHKSSVVIINSINMHGGLSQKKLKMYREKHAFVLIP